jgi:hypothetical protein
VVEWPRVHPAGPEATHCLLALQTADGWFVQREGFVCRGQSGPSSFKSYATKRFAVESKDGRSDLIHVFRHTTSVRTIDPAPDGGKIHGLMRESEDRVVVCGVGETGPACIEPMSIGCEIDDDADPVRVRWSFQHGFLETTVVSDHNAEACDVAPGTHAIRYP